MFMGAARRVLAQSGVFRGLQDKVIDRFARSAAVVYHNLLRLLIKRLRRREDEYDLVLTAG